jgi:uncharacterized protein (TIGR00369 family)
MTASPRPEPALRRGPDGVSDEVAALWSRTDAVGFLRASTTGDLPADPHVRHTGNRLVEVPRPGAVVMEWTPGPQLSNLSGVVHGGYLALVCDEAAGLAAASTGERFVPMLTLDLDVTYLRPGAVGAVHRVEGQVLHAGRQRVVSEARVVRPDGGLAVTARGSFVPNTGFVEQLREARRARS